MRRHILAPTLVALLACRVLSPQNSITVNGAMFETVADPVWKAPSADTPDGTSVHLALRITNQSGRPLRFNKFDATEIRLADSAGRQLSLSLGRNGVWAGQAVSPPVAPGQSLVIEMPGTLLRVNGMRLSGIDEFGTVWYFDGISPGKYAVSFLYDAGTRSVADRTVWAGRALAPPALVVIR